MINTLQTTITALSSFPDRPNYTSGKAYGKAVATWLRENKELSIALATLIPELNTIIQQINSTTQNIEDIEINIEDIAKAVHSLKEEALAFKNLAQKYANANEDIEVEDGEYSAKHWALKAYSAVANLPIGTLIDTLIALDKTWSSTKIKGELDLKADKDVTYTKTQIDTDFQKKLESGLNIKTINGEDLMGSGNLVITGGLEFDTVGSYTIAGISVARYGSLEIGTVVAGSSLYVGSPTTERSVVLGGMYTSNTTPNIWFPYGNTSLGATGSWRVLTRIENKSTVNASTAFLALLVKIA